MRTHDTEYNLVSLLTWVESHTEGGGTMNNRNLGHSAPTRQLYVVGETEGTCNSLFLLLLLFDWGVS